MMTTGSTKSDGPPRALIAPILLELQQMIGWRCRSAAVKRDQRRVVWAAVAAGRTRARPGSHAFLSRTIAEPARWSRNHTPAHICPCLHRSVHMHTRMCAGALSGAIETIIRPSLIRLGPGRPCRIRKASIFRQARLAIGASRVWDAPTSLCS